ncbi:MAG: hypothetical protein C7B45_13565 [Sulfobacillus acidophilus]|uniref:MFS transporter n=1 Tax=Sulfobacillus acidophilus TaxID=53633 RepID=A0A2T2WEW5_9FIRM|nr:MAG: hypothetical protein C7B45_13565 [Sulfobacillus acidophilus]
MPSNHDVVLLALDDAVVTLGAQFREVALGLLITALNPHASSYAWYFLAASIPGVVFANRYAWASARFGPRQTMVISYALRLLLVLGLWRATNFWLAIAILAGIMTGSGFYSAAQAQYVAVSGDFVGTRNVVIRLRQSESVMRLFGPLLAGMVLTFTAYRNGFLLSALAYGIALVIVSRLSPIENSTPDKGVRQRLDWRVDAPSLAILALNFLIWQGNTLAIAYTFHVLHRHSFGYGLTLSVWGGSGFLASLWLARIRTRPMRWIPLLFALLGGSWLVLSLGVTFPVFVLLGGVEGLAGWMITDLIAASFLSSAPAGEAGYAQAKLGAYDNIGSILGTLVILVVPGSWLVLPMYKVLGSLAVIAGILFVGFSRRLIRPGNRHLEPKDADEGV